MKFIKLINQDLFDDERKEVDNSMKKVEIFKITHNDLGREFIIRPLADLDSKFRGRYKTSFDYIHQDFYYKNLILAIVNDELVIMEAWNSLYNMSCCGSTFRYYAETIFHADFEEIEDSRYVFDTPEKRQRIFDRISNSGFDLEMVVDRMESTYILREFIHSSLKEKLALKPNIQKYLIGDNKISESKFVEACDELGISVPETIEGFAWG